MCGLEWCTFARKGRRGTKSKKARQPEEMVVRTTEPPAPHQESKTYVLVLIMLDCDGKAFDNFIAKLPEGGASYNHRYEQPGLNLRGYKTALEIDYARSLRESQDFTGANILGVAYFGAVLLKQPPFQLPSGLKPPKQAQPGSNVGFGDLWHLRAVDASPSHLAGKGVNVYVMDSGINEAHAVSPYSQVDFQFPVWRCVCMSMCVCT